MAPPDRTALRRALAIAKSAFTPVALGGLLWFAWTSRDALAGVVAEARVDRLLAAVFAWIVIQGLVALFTSVALGACGSPVAWRRAFRSHAARLPARYLPGGIWHTVGRVADLRDHGVGPRPLAAFVVLENAVALGVTAVLGGAAVLGFERPDPWPTAAAFGVAAGVVGLTVLPRLVGRFALAREATVAPVDYLCAVAISGLFWIGAASAFVLYLSAFPGVLAGGGAVEAAGVYLFSWAIGFVAVFAPQGIGVFEVVAGDLLAAPMAFAGTAALIAGFRGVVLVADLALWAAGRWFLRG